MTHKTPAILWDMDGTIVDSKDCHFNAWVETLKKRGIDLDETKFTSSFGRNNTISLPFYLGYQPEPDVFDEIVHEKESLFLKMVLKIQNWFPAWKPGWLPPRIAESNKPWHPPASLELSIN